MSAKTAVILFNLGGPDAPAAVEPFLRNLFSDPAILRLPGFLRGPLARLIAARRAPVARDIYEKMGGDLPFWPTPKRRPGRWKSCWDRHTAASSSCATGTRGRRR